jgi:hypothetical protein
MAEHVIDCQQRGLPVTSQTQVLFAVNERFEFLTRHALVDPRIGTRRVTVRDLAKLRRLCEKREAAEELWQFEQRFVTETGTAGQETETRGEIGCYPPPVGRMDADRTDIEDCNRPRWIDPEEDAAHGEMEDPQQDQFHDNLTNAARGISTELLDGRASLRAEGDSQPFDMGDEIRHAGGREGDATVDRDAAIEEEDSFEPSRPPDEEESHAALNLKPTSNVLFVLSLLSEGLSYGPVHRFLTKIHVRHCSQRQFYRIQRVLVPWLHRQGKASCETALRQVAEADHIGFDGAWNHNRGGTKLIGTLCNVSKPSVVGYSIVEKRSRLFEPFAGPPKTMEAKSFRELLPTLTSSDLKFAGLVTDGDVSLGKIIRDETKIRHLLDIAHCTKSLMRCLSALDKKNGGILDPFADQLLVWFRYLVSQNCPVDAKKELWRNALSHFRGDHSKCLHAPNDREPAIRDDETRLIGAMTECLSSTSKYFDLLQAGVCTQVNESVNSKRTRFASKNLAWADSWIARMALAVLHFNNPYVCFTELIQKIGFDLPDTYFQSVHELFSESIRMREHPTGKRVASFPRGKSSSARVTGASLPPHQSSPSIVRRTAEQVDFFCCSSTESSDDEIEGDEECGSDDLTSSAPGRASPDLIAGFDLSGLDNENGAAT